MMKKKFAAVILSAVAAVVLAGCGQQSTVSSETAAESVEKEEETAAETEGEENGEAENEEAENEEAEDEKTDETEIAGEADGSVETVKLELGEVTVYDFGEYKLHAYNTNDALTDICYIIETDTNLIGIESPSFYDSLDEYMSYVEDLGKPMEDLLLPYHPVGGETLKVANTYANQAALDAMEEGGSNWTMMNGFKEAFGDALDGTFHEITEVVEPGTIEIGGMEFVITDATDGFDMVIPAINCAFIHMMGSDVHNILTSEEQIDSMIEQLNGYKDQGIQMVLTSHYMPEGMDAVDEKIAYLETVKELAAQCADSEEFISSVKEAFPNYGGESFLESTAGALFAE